MGKNVNLFGEHLVLTVTLVPALRDFSLSTLGYVKFFPQDMLFLT